jgi:hypothetical protein
MLSDCPVLRRFCFFQSSNDRNFALSKRSSSSAASSMCDREVGAAFAEEASSAGTVTAVGEEGPAVDIKALAEVTLLGTDDEEGA